MKQISQDLNTGEIKVLDTPVPKLKKGNLIIKSTMSLISSGTERMLLSFGKGNLIEKALQQPDKVKEVIQKSQSDGLINTFNAVKNKLDFPIPLGYCNVGEVVDFGDEVKGFKIGDRVVSNGNHAEIVSVPQNLCAKIPHNVNDEEAVFTVVSSIGLQGIRLANPTFGETFLVSGLGLIGQLTCQILKAQGCNVLAIDTDLEKCKLANRFNISSFHLSEESEPIEWIKKETKDIGIDGAIITASTSSTSPIHIAAEACRKRGRVILVGVTGLNLRRDLFYKKEISFQVSCSYGPGRYDENYEDKGMDYPIGYVRWTEQRNFQSILNSISEGKIKTRDLISDILPIERANEAYSNLLSNNQSLGIIIKYRNEINLEEKTIYLKNKNDIHPEQNISLAFIGTGNYARSQLLPAFKKGKIELNTIVSSEGLGPVFLGKKFGFQKASTNISEVIKDPNCNTVVICTRHDSHCQLICDALSNKKHVFVEKPLCLTLDELKKIESLYDGSKLLMIGFNRRFAPLSKIAKKIISKIIQPKAYIYTCNAGYIESEHWIHDIKIGGGRLIGEACHFLDYLRFLDSSPITEVKSMNISSLKNNDNFTINLKFESGSIGTIHYFANGHKSFPKERIEIFGDNKVITIDNFKKLKTWGIPNMRNLNHLNADKGQSNCVLAFLNSIKKGEQCPINFSEIIEIHNHLLNMN